MGILIGIGGISRAGKSRLSEYLQKQLQDAHVIHQDDYVKSEREIPRIKDRLDWEHPDSIHWPGLEESIAESLIKHQYTILEGLFAFYHKEIEDQMSLKIMLSLDKEQFLDLKKVDKRWGDEPNWFIDHIWHSHSLYGTVRDKSTLSRIHNIKDSDYQFIVEQVKNL